MTKEEVYKLIFVVRAVWIKTYEKFGQNDFDNMAIGWHMALEDYSYQEISLALKAYVKSNDTGFPPVPAQLIAYTRQSNPTSDLTSNEAWAIVYKAICNSNYNAEAEFEKLPELCKKAIGSAASLRELAQMDIDTVQSVEGSHFKRNYENLVKQKAEYEKIPQSIRQELESLTQIRGDAMRIGERNEYKDHESACGANDIT